MSYVENLSTKGMLRLSANERKEYFMQTYEITNFMDDRTCAAFQFGNDFIDPLKIREVLIDYYNSLSDAEVRHKLALAEKQYLRNLINILCRKLLLQMIYIWPIKQCPRH